ncbi:DUF1697 domain-containing protein [Flavisphingomonas formosensis]|uniref:DUF1697 domain-containing protein n=1 Tax=Flavisphingomonas formosensis TaxID=861534 RepID=UPI0012F8693C|nr:DUF1697 domain-containing protein [Sphingomonas formosensis]
MRPHVALLRAVNVGKRKMPMAELRALCAEIGFAEAKTYVASGNLVFSADGKAADFEHALETAIERHFGFVSEVIVRTPTALEHALADNPFAKAGEKEPNRVLLLFAKRKPAADAAARILERAQGREAVVAVGDMLWFHFPDGVGASKLTPSFIDRCVGSPATSRNLRTVSILAEMGSALA